MEKIHYKFVIHVRNYEKYRKYLPRYSIKHQLFKERWARFSDEISEKQHNEVKIVTQNYASCEFDPEYADFFFICNN